MSTQISSLKRTLPLLLVTLLPLAIAPPAHAAGVTVAGGGYSGTSRASIAYEVTDTPVGFSIVPIVELGGVRRQGDTAFQLALVPMFRYRFHSGFEVEAGIGPSVFNTTNIGDKHISTAFQFSDNIGLGYRFGSGFMVGYRISHYSNLNFKTPNPGINVQQLVFSVPF